MQVLNPVVWGFFNYYFAASQLLLLQKCWAFQEESAHFHKAHTVAQQMLLTTFQNTQGATASLWLWREPRCSHKSKWQVIFASQKEKQPSNSGHRRPPQSRRKANSHSLPGFSVSRSAESLLCGHGVQKRLTADKQFCHGIDRDAIFRMLINNRAQQNRGSHFRFVIRMLSTVSFTLWNYFHSNNSHYDNIVPLLQISSFPVLFISSTVIILCPSEFIEMHFIIPISPLSHCFIVLHFLPTVFELSSKAHSKPITTSCKLAFILLWLLKCVLINSCQ